MAYSSSASKIHRKHTVYLIGIRLQLNPVVLARSTGLEYYGLPGLD